MKLKLLFLLVIIGFFSISLLAQTKKSDAKLSRELIGIWQNSPHVASGLNDIYRFYENGNFEFEYNSMNWSKRKLSFAGKWRISNGNLILTITKQTNLVGGKKVKTDEASSSGDIYEIEGGKAVTRKIKPAKTETYKSIKVKKGEMSKFINIGKIKYWRISIDPKSYTILC